MSQIKLMKRFILILGFLYFTMHDVMAQCAACKAVAETQAEDDGSSINTGIIYIMVMPYVILCIVFRKKIFGLFRSLRDRDF